MMSIDELGLPTRALNCLRRAHLSSVGDVLSAYTGGFLRLRQLGEKSHDAVVRALERHLDLPRCEFWSFSGIPIDHTVPQGIAASTDTNVGSSVSSAALDLSISVVGLSARTERALIHANVSTVRDLLRVHRTGVMRVKGIGHKAATEIEEALARLTCERPLGAAVEGVPQTHRYPLGSSAPADVPSLLDVSTDTPPNLIRYLPMLVSLMLKALRLERHWDVLRCRYGIGLTRTFTLQEIGNHLGLTRERVRQMQSSSEKRIAKYLLGAAASSRWRVPQVLIAETKALGETLHSWDMPVLRDELVQMLEERYSCKLREEDVPSLKLLMSLLRFEPIPVSAFSSGNSFVAHHDAWLADQVPDKKLLHEAIRDVHRVLRRSDTPLSLFELAIRINGRTHHSISKEQIRMAIKTSREIEPTNNQGYQIRLEYLSSLADMAYRVLKLNGSPMSVTQLARHMNAQLVTLDKPKARARSIAGQLVGDPRFQPVGRSGGWSLAEWKHVPHGTIMEIMEEFFHLHQRSATATEVYEFVKTKRPDVSRSSVWTFISNEKGVFAKVTRDRYELLAWGSKPARDARRERVEAGTVSDALQETIPHIFGESTEKRIRLSELVRRLRERFGFRPSTIDAAIRRSSMLSIERDAKDTRVALVRYLGINRTSEKRILLKDAVVKAVEQFLKVQPSGRAKLTDVVGHVMKVTGARRTSVYAYMPRVQGVRKERIEGTTYCQLNDPPGDPLSQFPELEEVRDEALLENLKRAVNGLTLDMVDVALFQLGRILEAELKAYLLAARQAHRLDVSSGDLQRLASMIDCVHRNGIVKDGHHLALLRQERNERAHGEIPDLAQRRELMAQAPSITGLFLYYIVLFHRKRMEL